MVASSTMSSWPRSRANASPRRSSACRRAVIAGSAVTRGLLVEDLAITLDGGAQRIVRAQRIESYTVDRQQGVGILDHVKARPASRRRMRRGHRTAEIDIGPWTMRSRAREPYSQMAVDERQGGETPQKVVVRYHALVAIVSAKHGDVMPADGELCSGLAEGDDQHVAIGGKRRVERLDRRDAMEHPGIVDQRGNPAARSR